MGHFQLGVKRLECETNHIFPYNAEVKNEWSITSTTPYVLITCRETNVLSPHLSLNPYTLYI